jgi:hypothetical protein
MGFFDSLSKGWTFTKEALVMAKHGRLLLPSLYQVLISVAYFIAVVAVLVVVDPHWSDATWAVVGAIITFGSFLIFYFFCGVTVNMIDVHLKGGTPSFKDGVADAKKNFLAIVWLALISALIETFARAARNEDSIVGKILAGIVEAIWTTLSFLLLPTIIIEDAGFKQAMGRVRDLHKGHLMLVAVGDVGVRAITFIIGLIWFALIFAIVFASFSALSTTTALVITFLVGGSMFAIYAAFSTFLRMAYYTCLYLYAAEVEKHGVEAPAPLPLAIALGKATRPVAA